MLQYQDTVILCVLLIAYFCPNLKFRQLDISEFKFRSDVGLGIWVQLVFEPLWLQTNSYNQTTRFVYRTNMLMCNSDQNNFEQLDFQTLRNQIWVQSQKILVKMPKKTHYKFGYSDNQIQTSDIHVRIQSEYQIYCNSPSLNHIY